MKKLILITAVFCASCASQKATHFAYHKKSQKFVSNETLRKRHEKTKVVLESVAMFGLILFIGNQIEK